MSLFQTLIPSLTRSPVRQGNEPAAGPAVKPIFDLKETADAYCLMVYLPGVAKDGLEFTAEDGQIRIVGRRAWQQPAGWTSLYRESADVPYELALTHDNAVDAGKIAAELRDGVLRVSLPKHEALKPRRIAVS